MTSTCPELEVLFDELHQAHLEALEHSKACAHCAALLEDHRQLEKDLFRLADPLPPPDFVHLVMQRVAAAPVPIRSELKVFLSVVTLTVMGGILSFVAMDGSAATLATRLASGLLELRALAIALSSGLSLAWNAAAAPMTATLVALLFISLLGLRRLTGGSLAAKVTS